MGNNFTHTDICMKARRARQEFDDRNFPTAYRMFAEAFESNPKAWWLAMEAIRSIRAQRSESIAKHIAGQILFSPDYTTGNSYQTNLYSEASKFGFTIEPVRDLDLQLLLSKLIFSRNKVFHQHWIKEYYWNASSFEDGVRGVQRRISILKALKAFGIKVVWTLHNLIDHDATDLQRKLCIYTHQEMARVSDIIYVHTRNSSNLLSEQCELNIENKCHLLEHPLYDNISSIDGAEVPKEINIGNLAGKKVLVHLGMIKPYKGVADLLNAFNDHVRNYPSSSLYLIIGGKVYDPAVSHALGSLGGFVRERLILIDRRLSESEMSALLRLANISITPYRNILISGSYYLSTTFRKPTIAPRIGMFRELIKDGESGILYDGTVAGLAEALRRIDEMSSGHLATIGDNNYNANSHLSVNAVSDRYFTSLGVAGE